MQIKSKFLISLALAVPSTLAAINGKCSSGNGVCVTTTSCTNAGGTYKNGLCPNDAGNVKCCNKSCSVNGVSGQCMFKSQCTGSSYTGQCPGGSDFICCIPNTNVRCTTSSGLKGTCINTSQCKGTSYPGYCPGTNNIQCCVTQVNTNVSCTTKSGLKGTCMNTSQCTGTSYSGYCPGASNIQCCVTQVNTNVSCTISSGVKGTCMDTSKCTGTRYSGYCPGASNIQCCVTDSAGNTNPGGSGGGNPSTSGFGDISTKFDGTKLSRSEFVSKVETYCASHSNLASALCNNAGLVYDTSKNNNVNALLVIVRAIIEANSPGDSKNNYWGIGCVNGGGVAACYSYGSLAEGIAGFANTVTKYDTLAGMMSKYAYIGAYWYNPGSWSDGGCKYFPYIKKYMSAARSQTVTAVCNKTTTCDIKTGGDCTPTIAEDQNAYAKWQVDDKMGPTIRDVFGI